MIAHVLNAMWNGERFESDERYPLAGLVSRLRVPRVGTLLRYAVRSLLLGIVLLFLYKGYYDPYGKWMVWELKISSGFVFGLSMAWRLLRPIKRPKWRSATISSLTQGLVASRQDAVVSAG
jgi:hypothetical protein